MTTAPKPRYSLAIGGRPLLADEKTLRNRERFASALMLVANALACAQIYDLIPSEPSILKKLALFFSALLSTYGFRSALKLPAKE